MEETSLQQGQAEVIVGTTAEAGQTTKNLADIFEKMEQGVASGKTAEQVIADQPKSDQKAQEPKKEEVKKEEPKPEPEKEDTKEASGNNDDPREVLKRAMQERAAKRQQTEKVEDKKEEKKPEKAEATEKQDESVEDDELQVLPHDKPRTAKRIQALLKKIEEERAEIANTKKERDDKAAKLSELEKKLADVKTVNPETDEKIKAQLNELSMFRRRYQLESDPEVKSKFDSRVESAEQSILDVLKKHNAGQEFLNLVKNEGGWSGFSGSGRSVTINDGNGGTKTVTYAELADSVMQNLPLTDRKSVEAAMIEQLSTKRERDRFFKEEQEKADKFFKEREETAKKQFEEQQKRGQEAMKTIEDWKAKQLESPMFKEKEVPENATAEQKAEIAEHNNYVKQLKSLFNKNMGVNTLEGIFDIQLDAIKYYDERRTSNALREEVEHLRAELEAKQKEINNFRSASRSVVKGGSIATAPTKTTTQEKKPRGLEAAFDMLERGEDPNASEE